MKFVAPVLFLTIAAPAMAAQDQTAVPIQVATLDLPPDALSLSEEVVFAGDRRAPVSPGDRLGADMGEVQVVGRSRKSCDEALARAIRAMRAEVESRGGGGVRNVKSVGVDGPDGTRKYVCQQGRLMSVSLVGTLRALPPP